VTDLCAPNALDILCQHLMERRESLLNEVDGIERMLIELGRYRGLRTTDVRKAAREITLGASIGWTRNDIENRLRCLFADACKNAEKVID